MIYKIEMLPKMKMVYMRNIGPYGSEEKVEMMKTFKKWINQHLLNDELKQYGIYGVPQDDPARTLPENCRYDLMFITDKDFSKDQMVQTGYFEGGKYAVFTVAHTTEKVNLFWSQLNIRQVPILERYKEEVGEDKACEFLLPIY